jgi:diguanylate cyclase (GGDEF)-like protein
MVIGELMAKVAVGIAPNEMFLSVVLLMREKNRSCILVSEKGKPKGIITERDVVRFFAETILHKTTTTSHFNDVPVTDVMTHEPVCVQETTSLYDALLLSRSRNLRHLLVVDENEMLVGLVTQTDMVNAYVNLMERQTELESANQALHLLSHEDSLMKIGNRRAMEVDLNFTEASAKRYNRTYSVALIDVDFFKKFNDYYGHQAGDDALVAIACAIKSIMRKTDRLYRYGGEEILLLLPETSGENALVAAERARKAVKAIQLPHTESHLGQVTISIGVASEQKEGWKALVARADRAFYKAKKSGRNNVYEDTFLFDG